MAEVLPEACERVFRYPSAPQSRRHGPCGYTNYQSYKPWLRDEFSFRCLYCLWRERWEADGHHGFGVEHVEPQVTSPEQRIVYDNVVYACNTCNSTRRDVPLPLDIVNDSLGLHLQVLADGTVQTLSETGEELVELCRLNRPLLVAARRRILNLIAVLRTSDHPEAVEALRDLLAYPSDLPNLSALRPPGGNERPAGITDCFFERRRRGALPEVY